MLDRIFTVWDAFLQMTSMTLISRYIFFEKPLEAKKQRIFYIISYILIAVSSLFSEEFTSPIVSLLIVLNILLARKNHKIRGALLLIPITGVAAGLFMPIIYMPLSLLTIDGTSKHPFQFVVYSCLTILAIIVFINKQRINRALSFDLENRTLRKWEKVLLVSIGLVLSVAVGFFDLPEFTDAADAEYIYTELISTIFVMGIICVFMTVATIITIIAGNKQSLYQKRITDMQFNIIVMMADLVENRDANTGGHIKRTARYVEIIAKKLKAMGKFPDELTNEYIADIIVAAPLHDIGKIHVSDNVLNKNGRLNDEEFAIMKSHAPAGKSILEHAKEQIGDFSYLDIAVQMASAHHEWWDGSKRGYPLGTSGNDIPLSARIMAVADVFDALTSKRVYKDPMPSEKAYSIILEESGTHFDPVIIDAFVAAKDEINEALDKFMEE